MLVSRMYKQVDKMARMALNRVRAAKYTTRTARCIFAQSVRSSACRNGTTKPTIAQMQDRVTLMAPIQADAAGLWLKETFEAE